MCLLGPGWTFNSAIFGPEGTVASSGYGRVDTLRAEGRTYAYVLAPGLWSQPGKKYRAMVTLETYLHSHYNEAKFTDRNMGDL